MLRIIFYAVNFYSLNYRTTNIPPTQTVFKKKEKEKDLKIQKFFFLF